MDDRIIICKKDGNIVTAVFRGNVCFRLSVNPADEPLRIGNIYTGRIASMVPNMNAWCFMTRTVYQIQAGSCTSEKILDRHNVTACEHPNRGNGTIAASS